MVQKISRNKVFGAGNQQERLRIENWIVGFTDGEGCFSVSLIKNTTTKSGWQVFPEFVVTQGEKSLHALEMIRDYFKCGNIFINKRYDNHNENLYRFCVRSIMDLEERVIPFFKKHHLFTAKQKDFKVFVGIIQMMKRKEHLSKKGMKKIALKIQKMNRKKTSRFLDSSETIRQASRAQSRDEDIVRTAWRHAEQNRNVFASRYLRSNNFERNSLSGKFRRARMA